MSGAKLDIDKAFPYPDYREHQRHILQQASAGLFDNPRYDNVVIFAPTGIGKSAINTALARQAESAFITTPQKKLRQQLEDDDVLNSHYQVLRGRNDYSCSIEPHPTPGNSYTCKTCPIYTSRDRQCTETIGCPYWRHKEEAMNVDIATLTFAYLIHDSRLNTYNSNGRQISFNHRELVIIDESHQLEQQTASLFAGFTVSPYTLPGDVFGDPDSKVDDSILRFGKIQPVINEIADRADGFIKSWVNRPIHRHDDPEQISRQIEQCDTFLENYSYCLSEVGDNRPWVVDVEYVEYNGSERPSFDLMPVDVDRFLDHHVWSRAHKRVLSTATMPFSDNPERWLMKLGLDPNRTKIIRNPMPFEPENRLVYTDTIIAKFSDGRDEENWNSIVNQIDKLSDNHEGEKGLIHATSYSRAKRLFDSFSDDAVLHRSNSSSDRSDQEYIDEWQRSDNQMLFSPAMMDGVDLPDDQCRWQVLVKVPYPNPSNSRVNFLLEDRNDWDWYYETTAQQLIQSVGRGVRHEDDYCSYYVLDDSFIDVMRKASIPDWFDEAITDESV